MSMRTKSAVWDYFLRCPNGEDKMVCRICNATLSGRNASNAKKHMRYAHRDDYEQVEGQDQAIRKRPADSQTLESSFMASIELLTNSIEQQHQQIVRESTAKFTNQEKDMLIWLSKPTISLCTLITDDFQRFIRNFDSKFDLPKRKSNVVNLLFKCARHIQCLIDGHIRNALSRFAVTVNIWQVDNVMLIGVIINFIDKQFKNRRLFLGSSVLKPNQSMDYIKSKVYSILQSYNINDNQISAFITNGPPEFMTAFKKDYDEVASLLNESEFISTFSKLGIFSEENDDFCLENNEFDSDFDVFANFTQVQHQMQELFEGKHVFSLEIQIEFVMSQIGTHAPTEDVLNLIESFRKDPDFFTRLSNNCPRSITMSLKPNWRCRFFSAKRILELYPYMNQVANERFLPTITDEQIQQITDYIELLEPFVNLICSAQPEKMFSEVYGLIQSLIFHCTKIMEKQSSIYEQAKKLHDQIYNTFYDVLNVKSTCEVSYVAAALLNPNQAYLVDINRTSQIECISSIYNAYKRPFFVKPEEEETSSSSNADTQRIESFEELMLKKRRLEESSRRDAMQNEKIQKSPSQLADFYLNLVSTRPSNCNSLEFWKNATLDFDPLVPLALDFAAIPSMVSIYDFFSTLGIQKLTNSDIQFFTIRLMIYMNKHILLD